MVEIGHIRGVAGGAHFPAIEKERLRAQGFHHPDVMAHEDDCFALFLKLLDAPNAPVLKDRVAHRQSLVHQQQVRVDVNGGGERQADKHAARVRLHGLIDEVADLGKRLDGWDAGANLLGRESHDGPLHHDVLAAGELRVEPRAQLEERRHPALHGDPAVSRLDDAGDHLQERALAGTVHADDPQRGALPDLNGDVPESPEVTVIRAPSPPEGFEEAMAGVCVDPVRLGDGLDVDPEGPHQSTSTKACFDRRKNQ